MVKATLQHSNTSQQRLTHNNEQIFTIGVLTQPIAKYNEETFSYLGKDQYILEVNQHFLEDAGNVRVVPIYYDESDDVRLYKLLAKLNGVHFTGGGLTLIDKKSPTFEQHKYYKTAKKILQYSIKLKDEFNIDFPITGICQGFEALIMMVGDDNHELLSDIPYFNVQRKINWNLDKSQQSIKQKSKLFSQFDQKIIDKLANENQTLHLHEYSTYLEDFNANKKLTEFFNVIATDVHPTNNKPYVIIIEAKKYPIYAMMFHSEYQLLDQSKYEQKLNTLANDVTTYTYKTLSQFIKSQLMLNDHQFESYQQMEYFTLKTSSSVSIQDYKMTNELLIPAFALYNPEKLSFNMPSFSENKPINKLSYQLSMNILSLSTDYETDDEEEDIMLNGFLQK